MKREMNEGDRVVYRFEEARALEPIPGLSLTQTLLGLAALAISVAGLLLGVALIGLAIGAGLVVAGFLRPFRRPGLEGVALLDGGRVGAAYGAAALRGRTRWRRARGGPTLRSNDTASGCVPLPERVGRFRLISPPGGVDGLGVLVDEAARAASVTLRVRLSGSMLADDAQAQAEQDAWGRLLGSFARDHEPVRRVSWLSVSTPARLDEIARDLDERATDEFADVLAAYHVAAAAPATAASEQVLLLSIQLCLKRRAKLLKKMDTTSAGGPDEAVWRLMHEEGRLVVQTAQSLGIRVDGGLSARALGALIRRSVDPASSEMQALGRAHGHAEGVPVESAGPLVVQERLDRARTDSVWQRTFWVERFPQREVTGAFLTELLAEPGLERRIAWVGEPVPPSRAIQQASRRAAAREFANSAKEQKGFRVDARERNAKERAGEQEQEVAAGHAAYTFAAYVTVCARSEDELDAATTRMLGAGARSFLSLRLLAGEQQEALAYTLPGTCRGLA